MKTPIVIFGENGQLGQTLKTHTALNNHFETHYYNRNTGDISNFEMVATVFETKQPHIVINCAAYTKVDLAEDEQMLAHEVNHLAVENLAKQCAKTGVLFIHVSTDYVFDGESSSPISENEITNPQSVYGASKLLGEQAIEKICSQYYLLRTAWVFSDFGNNFLKTMLRLGNEKTELNVVGDQFGTPTSTYHLAKTIFSLCEKLNSSPVPFGVYHCTNSGSATWAEFAEFIMTEAKLNCEIHTIPTSMYPTKATRPKYSVLNNTKLNDALGEKAPSWKKDASNCISKILSSQS